MCASERPEHGGLAGAVRADQGDSFALAHTEADPAHGLQESVTSLQIMDLQQGHGPAFPRYASTTAASRSTTSGLPLAITLPASIATSRSMT